jgi:hypothetical protein
VRQKGGPDQQLSFLGQNPAKIERAEPAEPTDDPGSAADHIIIQVIAKQARPWDSKA